MENYLLGTLENYFDEINLINARLHLVTAGLNRFKDEMHEKKGEFAFSSSSITTFRDLSIPPAQNNLFAPNFSYDLELEKLNEEIELIISRESCLIVSQAYEVFESFFLEIIMEYFYHNQNQLTILKVEDLSKIFTKIEIRKLVKNSQDTNNRGLISIIRKISSYYEKYEANNCFDLNISHWFDLVSAVRHTIVHSRQKVTKGLLNYFEKHKNNKVDTIFSRNFEIKNVNEVQVIFLTSNQGTDIITWLNSYAHFIYKCLSGAGNLDIRVPLYSPLSSNLFQLLKR
jgi:hypothetical protein